MFSLTLTPVSEYMNGFRSNYFKNIYSVPLICSLDNVARYIKIQKAYVLFAKVSDKKYF